PWSEPQRFNTGSFDTSGRKWPEESRWARAPGGDWALENRQRADFKEIAPRRQKRLENGNIALNFGRAAFGTLKLTLSCAPGKKSHPSSVIVHRSSIIRHRSSVIGHPSSVTGHPSLEGAGESVTIWLGERAM